jgi:hypothetical protein
MNAAAIEKDAEIALRYIDDALNAKTWSETLAANHAAREAIERIQYEAAGGTADMPEHMVIDREEIAGTGDA